jgi:chromosomal replication initiation ATPase DnaA
MNNQLIFKFPTNKVYLKEDFYVSSSNKQAYDFINSWPQWIKRIVNIFGPAGSGKTHLVSILKNKTTTFEIQSNKLNEKVFLQFKTKEALIVENLDSKISENLLFSLWNNVLQDNKYLLITSNKPINAYKFQLPDLNSRIKSCISFGIKLPDDNLISVILAKSFSDKQIKVEKKHIDHIIKRLDRQYEKIYQLILIQDQH